MILQRNREKNVWEKLTRGGERVSLCLFLVDVMCLIPPFVTALLTKILVCCFFQIRYLSLVGGADVAETTRRIMRKLGTNHLWSNFNMCGRKGKRGLKTTRFFPVIVRKYWYWFIRMISSLKFCFKMCGYGS